MSPARVVDPTVLDRVVEAATRAGGNGVVVFDLDSTLLDNRPRQARILREYGERHQLGKLVASQPAHWTSWDLRDAMRAAGSSDAEIELHGEPAKAYWREKFFTSEYCSIDGAVGGAAAYVARLVGTGTQIAYCTGRHEQMRAGTVRSFERLGLPVPGARVHLLMKPRLEQSDDAWKEQAYVRLRAIGRVVATFDNEPTHINGYRSAFPDAICVHLATDHSGRSVVLLDGILSVENF
jgi:phosphoglycolate phosphatase-like HAD superfamily hydrolase